jgi:glutamine amidotransferase
MKWMLWDYGVGNLHSLQKALVAIGENATITTDPEQFLAAEVAVLPGVGAFGHVMNSLDPVASGLRERHAAGKPILGICVGMQVMYQTSEEADVPGLALLTGNVSKLQAKMVPHMGWNDVQGNINGVLYYVHSYAVGHEGALATTEYEGQQMAAAVRSGKTIGFQFHPEKSGPDGLAILEWARDQYKEQK